MNVHPDVGMCMYNNILGKGKIEDFDKYKVIHKIKKQIPTPF